jgi:hypothetical protein
MKKETKDLLKRYSRIRAIKEKRDSLQIGFIYFLFYAIAAMFIYILTFLPK